MTQVFSLTHYRYVALTTMIIALLASCSQRPDIYDTPPPPAPIVKPHPYTQAPATPAPEISVPLVKEAPAAFTGTEVKAAILLPLSGKASSIGKPMLDAAMLALFDKYASSPNSPVRIALMPKDTQGEANRAAKVAQDAIDEGATIIIGPLFSDNARAVSKVAKASNVPVISFSNNKNVADSNTYLFGFMPDNQISTIITYADQHDINTMAVLLPDTDYGRLVEELITDEAAQHGIRIIYAQRYDENSNAMSRDIQLFANKLKHEDIPPDALFLAQQGAPLSVMLEQLKRYGYTSDAVQFIGTGLWDDAALAQNNMLSGAWFASSPHSYFEPFNARFSNAEGYAPPRLASLSYDAVALVATLADTQNFSADAMTQPTGYIGPANGLFRLRRNGTIERELSVMSFENGKIVEKAPAKRMFYQ